MNTTPNGKISRLPAHLREEINLRLFNGQIGRQIVAWLNSLPEVQATMAEFFNGRPIDEGNLSEWRKRSYEVWSLDRTIRTYSDRFPSI